MKILLLFLVLISGCSVSRFYKRPEVSMELQKNSQKLQLISSSVEQDFEEKEAFYKKHQTVKNNFVKDDLAWRLADLKTRKDSILSKTAQIKNANDFLISHLGKDKIIKESDSAFDKIQDFQKIKEKDAPRLFKEFEDYKMASSEFTKFVFFTRNNWIDNEGEKR